MSDFSKELPIPTVSICIPSTYSIINSVLDQCGFWTHYSAISLIPSDLQVARSKGTFSVYLAWLFSSSKNYCLHLLFETQSFLGFYDPCGFSATSLATLTHLFTGPSMFTQPLNVEMSQPKGLSSSQSDLPFLVVSSVSIVSTNACMYPGTCPLSSRGVSAFLLET